MLAHSRGVAFESIPTPKGFLVFLGNHGQGFAGYDAALKVLAPERGFEERLKTDSGSAERVNGSLARGHVSPDNRVEKHRFWSEVFQAGDWVVFHWKPGQRS